MLLRDELDSFGCDADEKGFMDALGEEFARENRDRTVDEMLCDWPAASRFCRRVSGRFRLGHEGIADEMILRWLLNKRKNDRRSLPDVARAGIVPLKASLVSAGVDADPERFRATIRGVYLDLHRRRPVERTLCAWRDAAHLCGVVCRMLNVERSVASDALILRTLMNMRRSGLFSRRDREEAPR